MLRDVVNVCDEQQIHQPGRKGERRAVLVGDRADIAEWAEVPGDEVREAYADRPQRRELVEQPTLGRVEMPVYGDADHEERHDDDEKCRGPAPPAEGEMASAGKKERQDHCGDRAGYRFHGRLSNPSKCGASLSNVVLRSSGTRRVRAVTVMKFESPLHLGTMCRW